MSSGRHATCSSPGLSSKDSCFSVHSVDQRLDVFRKDCSWPCLSLSFPPTPQSLLHRLCFPAQGRCTRENCKYLHPPAHLKTQLEINGRNNLIQQKTAAAMLAQQMQFMIPGTTMQPVVSAGLAYVGIAWQWPCDSYENRLELCTATLKKSLALFLLKHLCISSYISLGEFIILQYHKFDVCVSLTCFHLPGLRGKMMQRH